MILLSRIFFTFLVFCISVPCFAVEITEKNGKRGVFLTEEEFSKVLADKEELQLLRTEKVPQLELKISKLELLVSQKDQELVLVGLMLSKKDELYEAGIKLEKAENDKLKLKIETLERWYRSPSVYLISGVLLGGALSVGLSYGLER